MAAGSKSKHLEAFIQSIKDEWKGAFRKYPDLTILALQEDVFVGAIERRFADNAAITNVRQLDYDFYTGLFNLVFEFARGARISEGRELTPFWRLWTATGRRSALLTRSIRSSRISSFRPCQPRVSSLLC